MTHEEIVSAWNAQADEDNQWDCLSEDEKVEFAYELGLSTKIGESTP